MQYFLFDIDGTLLLSGGAGRVAMTQVMDEMFGLTDLARIEVHGRTDRGIIANLFSAHDLPQDDDVRAKFAERYHELLPSIMHQCDGQLMPGVIRLLESLNSAADTVLGILTGNSESAAWTKLRHFGLDHFFEFGGYGEKHANRDDVARLAFEQCRSHHANAKIEPHQVWVVGDTIHDISCARSIGANVVAVATGGANIELLSEHEPDALFDDLSDHERFLAATKVSV